MRTLGVSPGQPDTAGGDDDPCLPTGVEHAFEAEMLRCKWVFAKQARSINSIPTWPISPREMIP